MNCEIIDKLISAYIDRELKGDLEPKVRYHLAYCGRCFKTYVEMKKTKELLSSLRSHELPDGFWKDTRTRFRPQAVRPAAVSKRRSSRLLTVLAAAACLLLTASMVSLAPDPSSEIRHQAGETGRPIAAALPEVNSLVNWDGPVGFRTPSRFADFGHADGVGPLVNAMKTEIVPGRDIFSDLGTLDLSRVLRPDNLDLPGRTEGGETDGENDTTVTGGGRPGVKTDYYGSPMLVPAGWTGRQ